MKKKQRIILLTALAALLAAVLGFVCFTLYQRTEQEKETRRQYKSIVTYRGTWTIDRYAFAENGQGVAVHWKSANPEEDALYQKYNGINWNKNNIASGSSNQHYIIRNNIKVSNELGYIDSRPKDASEGYFTLSVY